jgi:hypothetical protein
MAMRGDQPPAAPETEPEAGLPEVAGAGHRAPTRAAADAARGFLAQARAPVTLRAYAADWRAFAAWCESADLPALPANPATVTLFVAAQATLGRKPSTLARRAVAIGLYHRAHGHPRPQDHPDAEVLAGVLRGATRAAGRRPARKRAADADVVWAMLRTVAGDGTRARRLPSWAAVTRAISGAGALPLALST